MFNSISLVSGGGGTNGRATKRKATATIFVERLCLLALTLTQSGAQSSPPAAAADGGACFRAAVFQGALKRFDDCQKSAAENLAIYERVARKAAQSGAKIIVFPEDGLFIGSRRYVEPCLVALPPSEQIESHQVNPCDDADDRQSDNALLRRLSCAARDNNLFVVANFGTRQDCAPGARVGRSLCPKQGHFMLNTNVVFDSRGRLVKVYHKFNPFIEVYDGATQLELAYFDTDFGGRFGVFTCFDILYKSPAIDLIEQHHIGTALFPTWWFDKPPVHTAIQYQDAWSMGNRVNLLASNLFEPARGSIGFGIYSAANESVYSGADHPAQRLIVANLHRPGGADQCQFDPLVIDIESDDHKPSAPYKPYGHFELSDDDLVVKLNKPADNIKLCLGSICCQLEYELASAAMGEYQGRLILIVKDGLAKTFHWWEQTCLLATLEMPFDPPQRQLKDVKYSLKNGPEFKRLALSGKFPSKYVMPTASHNFVDLIDRHQRLFNCSEVSRAADQRAPAYSCEQRLTTTAKVNSFGLYARVFEKDQPKEEKN